MKMHNNVVLIIRSLPLALVFHKSAGERQEEFCLFSWQSIESELKSNKYTLASWRFNKVSKKSTPVSS